jgi:hypothetical protein
MADPVARHLQGGPHPTVGVQQGRGVAVAVGVDPDDGGNLALEHGHGGCSFQDGDRWLAPAWVASPRGGRTVRGHARRADGLLHQASDDGGPGRCRQLEDRSAARHATGAASEDWSHSPCRRQPASTQTRHHKQHHSEEYCEREVDELELQGGRIYLHLEAAGATHREAIGMGIAWK